MSMNIRNRDLFEKCRVFVKRTLELVNSWVLAEASETNKIPDSEKNGSQADQGRARTSERLHEALRKHHNELVDSPEFADCVKTMRRDKTISKHLGQSVGIREYLFEADEWSYLVRLLTAQFDSESLKVEFDAAKFERDYQELEEFFYSDYLTFVLLSPLYNFDSDIDDIDLGDKARIRRITDKDVMSPWFTQSFSLHFMQILFSSFSPPTLDLVNYASKNLRTRYVVELPCKIRKHFGDSSHEAGAFDVEMELNKLLTAMRLFKSGSVYYHAVQTIAISGAEHMGGSVSGGFRGKQLYGMPYTLEAAETEDFREIWSAIKDLDLQADSSLAIAMERFNSGYEKLAPEDKLIDYSIAFEALLLLEDESAELGHRLAIRTARLLGSRYADRQEIMKKMKELYGIRSKVVHGRRRTSKATSAHELEELLKRVIKKISEELRNHNHDEIIRHLDLG